MLASKYQDDNPLGNKSWSGIVVRDAVFAPWNTALTRTDVTGSCRVKIGDMPTAMLNILELKFLAAIDFNLHTTKEQYDHYVTRLYAWANLEQDQPQLPPPSSLPDDPAKVEAQRFLSSVETPAILRRQGESCRRLPYPEKDV
jgi:hypothetical protein